MYKENASECQLLQFGMKSQPIKPYFVKKQNNKMLLTICYDALRVMVMVTQQRKVTGLDLIQLTYLFYVFGKLV